MAEFPLSRCDVGHGGISWAVEGAYLNPIKTNIL